MYRLSYICNITQVSDSVHFTRLYPFNPLETGDPKHKQQRLAQMTRRHFLRVCAVCEGKKSMFRKRNITVFLKLHSLQLFIFFELFYFLFKSFVKVELSYVFTINLFTIAENCTVKVNYLIKQVCFSLVGNYLRPSNNYRQLILT